MPVSPVVSAEWLQERLASSGTPVVKVLDVTWYSAKDAGEDYLKAHIPGAVKLDIMAGVQQTDLFPRNIPEAAIFAQNVSAIGVVNDDHIIVYDNAGQGGFFIGARAWWLFKLFGHDKVSVLDGGLAAWQKLGYSTEAGPVAPQKSSYKATFQPKYIKTYDDMETNVGSRAFCVADTRPVEAYSGTAGDPKTGHYPGATSCHMASTFLDADKSYIKPLQELKQVLAARGVDVSRPVTGMCNSGMSSCTAALVANMCGAPEVAVFLGGFTEWKARAKDGFIEQSS